MADSAIQAYFTAIDAVIAAVESGNYALAWVKITVADLCLAKIPMEMQNDSKVVKYRESMDSARESLSKAEKTGSASNDRRRMIRTRTGF